jgi:hypothetical protein
MTITYQNGRTEEALILSRTDTQMRAVLRNSDDVLALQFLSGTWVTEDCDPVTVTFASRRKAGAPLTEQDCICPADLASHLIHLLLNDSSEDAPAVSAVAENEKAVAAARIA